MMEKVSFRKYTVFLLVCFFSLVTNIFAAEKVCDQKNVTVNVTLPYGSVYTITKSGYEGFKCNFDGLSKLEATPYADGFNVKLKKVQKDDGTETIKCSYTKKISVYNAGCDDGGEKTFNITYTGGVEETFEYYLGFGIEFIDVAAQLGAKEIIDYSVQTENSEYIDMTYCDRGSANCKVYMSDVARNIDDLQNYISIVKFNYKVNGSNATYTADVHFNINAFRGAWAWDNWTDSNPLGFCNYTSDWEQASNTRTNGHTVYYYRSSSTESVLPNCTVNPSNVVPVEFKGWMPGVEGNTGISVSTSVGYSNNSNIYAVGECSAAVPAGTKVTSNTNYAPCYEMNSSYVRLSLSTGSVNSGDWTVSNASRYEYFHLGTSTEDTVVLPDVVYSGAFSENKSLQCWENTRTGQCFQPGDTVKTDGSVYRAVTDTEHVEQSYFKSVKVNSSVLFNVEGMTGCSVASGQPSGYLSASSQNGDCLVTGIKVTDPLQVDGAPAYIEVEIPLENGGKKIYKFTVESNVGLDAAGNGEFIVNPHVNSGEENAYTDSSGFQTSSCTTFLIRPGASKTVPGSGSMHSNIYSVTPQCDDANDYIAMCLDPGREAPESGEIYEKVYDIKASTEFGRLITYLVETYGIETFDDINSTKRMAAHIAVRIVAIKTGMGAASGVAYGHLHQPYQNVVDDIYKEKPTTKDEYFNILNKHMDASDSILQDVAAILEAYNSVNDDEKHGFERTIDTSKVESNGNGYIITYIGTITAPTNATNVNLVAPASRNGLSFSVEKWSEKSSSESGRTTYDYEVKITAANTLAVIPPIDNADKIALSFAVTYDGGQSTSNVFLTQPVGTAGALQRMILFDTQSQKLYIYFNVAPSDCDLPGLDYTGCTSSDNCPITCTSEANCPANSFNTALFKASGCCRYVVDEVTYAYVVNNICAAACTTSTMANVCDYSTTDNIAELYEIKEGSEYNGSKTGEGSGYKDAIAACVVNVENDIRVTDPDSFEKEDDNGNSISVEAYEGNTYCRVNCKEDWQISMDGFGNYIGEKAVAAGSYFQIENDIFIGGKRTCYTNYIDYDRFMNDLTVLSIGIINAYNTYSNLSHAYSDIKLQVDEDGGVGDGQTGGFPVEQYDRKRTYWKRCEEKTRTIPGSGSGSGTTETYIDCHDGFNDNDTLYKTYYEYHLNTDGEFEDPETGQGTYQAYDNNPSVDGKNSGTYGDTRNDVEKGDVPSYSVPEEAITCSVSVCPRENCITAGDDAAGYWECTVECRDIFGGCTGNQIYNENNRSDQEGAFEFLSEKLMTRLEGEMAGPRGTVAGNAARIRQLIDEMFKCQHFQLVNTTDDNSDYAKTNRITGQYYADAVPYLEIPTAFAPNVYYEYAEDAFMSILWNNEENYLEPYDKKNDAYYGGTEGAYKNATNATVTANLKLTSTSSTNVNLARNFLRFKYFKTGQTKWSTNSETGRKYDNGAGSAEIGVGIFSGTLSGDGAYVRNTISVCGITGEGGGEYVTTTNSKGISSSVLVSSPTPEWKGGSCFKTFAPYLLANYIRSSIENSSFYKNQGYWFNNIQDVKAHGETLEAALNNENAHNNSGYNVNKELQSGNWSPIGLMNVFPISLTTPRNMYTYTYTFKDIGSLSGGNLGRIMGAENAIIANNNRTCFYEVFEELCLCCGDKINTYVYNDPDENDLIKQMMAASGYGESKQDLIENNEGGTLAFATSSVNLSDIDLDASGRPVASNWSDKSPFTYGGEYNLNTSKGAQLKNAIESQGETIYSTSDTIGLGAEYSYYLTPTTLSKIREYNDKTGYELNFNNLKVYGRYPIAARSGCSDGKSTSCWSATEDELNNELINFQHYGSVFLEELAKDSSITSADTLARENNDKVCLVIDGKFTAADLNKMVKDDKCRWIDFVENLSDNGSNGLHEYVYPYTEGVTNEVKVTYFRLAFK